MMRRPAWLLLGCLASLARPGAADPADDVAGLVARYEAQTLHERVRDGGAVRAWPDSSGHGHDLTDEENGYNAVLRVADVNGRAAVRAREAGTYRLDAPFTLDDHTIVLVHDGPDAQRALCQNGSAGQGPFGVVLRGVDGRHALKTGKQLVPYEEVASGTGGYRVSVLGRDDGTLRAFVDGADVSSFAKLGGAFEVGRLFGIDLTRYKHLDGDGVRIAELIVYDRWLSDDERQAVTAYLGEKYGIPIVRSEPRRPPAGPKLSREEARLWLGSETTADLDRDEAVPIPWTVVGKAEPPFEAGEGKLATRLTCRKDGTVARVRVLLPVRTDAEGTALRVLLLKNSETWLPEEGYAGPIDGEATIDFEVTIELDAGDFLEVLTLRDGEPGVVTLAPGEARLAAAIPSD